MKNRTGAPNGPGGDRQFLERFEGKKVVLFGAGSHGAAFLGRYGPILPAGGYVVDNRKELWGGTLCGLPIRPPESVLREERANMLLVVAIESAFSALAQLHGYGIQADFLYNTRGFSDPSALTALEIKRFSTVLLRVETTSYCNFACTFCTHASMKRPSGEMGDALFRSVITQAAKLGFRLLDIRNFGEPLLDKRLADRVRFAKESGFSHIMLYTNAYLLSPGRYRALSEAGLDLAIVSLSPRREFEQTRKGIAYDTIIGNLKALRPALGAKIEIHIVAPDSTAEECRQARRELRAAGFGNVVQTHVHNWAHGAPSEPAAYIPCRMLWNSVTVLWDGRVPLCCLDYEGSEILGDLARQPLFGIVNGEAYRAMRRQQLDGTPPTICRGCTNFK